MKRDVEKNGILFHIGNQTPRKNEYERGLKYKLFVNGHPTSYAFSTIKAAKEFAEKNYFLWM